MQALRTVSVAVLLATTGMAVIGVHQSDARSLSNSEQPAEYPPLSYKGTQYVDSRGCVYVRAGDGAAVHWVPRVTRSREVLCGFKPTFANVEDHLPVIPDPAPTQMASAPVQAPPTKTATAPMVQVGAATSTAPAMTKSTEAPMPTVASALIAPAVRVQQPIRQQPALPPLEALAGKVVGERGCIATEQGGQMGCSTGEVDYILKRLPAGVTVRTADGGRMTTTEPTLVRVPVKRAPVTPIAPSQPPVMLASVAPAAVSQTVNACADVLGADAQYMATNGRYTVRCGPQAEHPSAYMQARTQNRLSTYNSNRTEVARAAGVASYALPVPVASSLPGGYVHAWTDGRLNPNRGPLTSRGDLQMAQVWSRTTPAYDLYAPRKKTFWEWLFGTPVKKYTVKTMSGTGSAPLQISTKSAMPARVPTTVPTAAARAQQTPTAQALRYVQVGTFGVPENAERSIARLSAMGYPVSSQTLQRGGKPLKIVLAGPFARPEQTLSALASVRGAGYGDAFARK
jgi:Sporulation related domain.